MQSASYHVEEKNFILFVGMWKIVNFPYLCFTGMKRKHITNNKCSKIHNTICHILFHVFVLYFIFSLKWYIIFSQARLGCIMNAYVSKFRMSIKSPRRPSLTLWFYNNTPCMSLYTYPTECYEDNFLTKQVKFTDVISTKLFTFF